VLVAGFVELQEREGPVVKADQQAREVGECVAHLSLNSESDAPPSYSHLSPQLYPLDLYAAAADQILRTSRCGPLRADRIPARSACSR